MKKEDFIPGKWYKDVDNNHKFITKFSHFDENYFCTKEPIYIYDGKLLDKISVSNGRMTNNWRDAKECPLEEIQHLLPEEHPNKYLQGYTVDGQIYTTEYKDQGLYIFKALGSNNNITWINPSMKIYVKNGDLSKKNGFTAYISATKEQEEHFNLCVKMGKYMDYSNTPEIAMQKRIEELAYPANKDKDDMNKESLFQEAIKRYPVGCTFKVAHFNDIVCTVLSHEKHNKTFVENSEGHLHINLLTREQENNTSSASVYYNDKWAEIVTLPYQEVAIPKKEYNYKVVHCKTQEEWDFVINIIPGCSSSIFRKCKYDVTPGGIEIKHGAHSKLEWFRSQNSLIYSFEEWCKLNNYNMPKLVEIFKRGDWVIYEGESNQWYTKGKAYKLGGKHYFDSYDGKSFGHFFTEKDDNGNANGSGEYKYRKALSNEIPNKESGDWCVQITPDNKESVKRWWEENCSEIKTFSLHGYYGMKNSKYNAHGLEQWGKLLSTQEFYQKIGYKLTYPQTTDKDTLLAEAKRRFPIGSKYKCVNSNKSDRGGKGWDNKNNCWEVLEYQWINGRGIYSEGGWILLDGKWATQVSNIESGNNNINIDTIYPTLDISPKQNSATIKIQAEVSNIHIPKSASITLKNTEREVKIDVKQVNSIKI